MEMVFIETPEFAVKFDRIATQEEMFALQNELTDNPEKGKIVKGTGGARKIRVRIGNKGKSGGARAIYYYVDLRGEIWFLEIFLKSDKPNITISKKKKLYKFIKGTIQ